MDTGKVYQEREEENIPENKTRGGSERRKIQQWAYQKILLPSEKSGQDLWTDEEREKKFVDDEKKAEDKRKRSGSDILRDPPSMSE